MLAIGGMVFGLSSCHKNNRPSEIAQLVKTAEVKEHSGALAVTYPGKIQAASDVKLSFRVAGPIEKILVEEGEYVKKGQILARMDPRDYTLQYDAAEAEYNQVKGEADRIIELYKRNSVSVNEYDKAVAAKERVTALYHAKKNALEDTRLEAPFNGYVQKKYFDAYEIVNQGLPVISMIGDDYLEVNIDIPSSDFIRRSDFVNFNCVADVYPGAVLPLELLDINQKANFNQLFKVRFRLKKAKDLKLAPGMSVSVTIQYKPSGESLAVVPISALFQKEKQSYVWLLDKGAQTVKMVPVKVRQVLKSGETIVESDLRQGEVVISAGVNHLKEGEKVRPLPPVPASNVGGLL